MGKPRGKVSRRDRTKASDYFFDSSKSERPRLVLTTPVVVAIKEDGPAPVTSVGRMTLTLKNIIAERGCAFLENDKGESVFLGLKVLQRDWKGPRVSERWLLECEVEDHPNGKGPRVKKIFSARPPPQ